MSVDAPERIWVYHNGNSQTYLTAPNKFHNIEYVLADKLEELAAENGRLNLDSLKVGDQMLAEKFRADKAEAALAAAKRENEALREKAQNWSMEADKYKRALDRCLSRNAGGNDAE